MLFCCDIYFFSYLNLFARTHQMSQRPKTELEKWENSIDWSEMKFSFDDRTPSKKSPSLIAKMIGKLDNKREQ